MGYDLVLDFGGKFSSLKRQFITTLSFLSKIATTCSDLQLDPPESRILFELSSSISFINKNALLKSGLYDGVVRTIMIDIIDKVTKGEIRTFQV